MRPNIDSGATPIGSAGRAPDKQKKTSQRSSVKEKPVGEVQSKKLTWFRMSGEFPEVDA
jgi:hypothetical protein